MDGMSRIDSLVNHASNLGMKSLAITDHGSMYGAIDFYKAAKASNINPIIGVEGYVAHSSRLIKNNTERSPFHITLLAQNDVGYQNLIKLVSKAHTEGFYYRPRVDRELLAKYSEGIIVLSGCPSGELSRNISNGNLSKSLEIASWYKEVFKERYFIEIMRHGDVPELPEINDGLINISKDLKVPIVATNDSHYTLKTEAHLHDVLLCIQTSSTVDDTNRMKFGEDTYYLRSHEEMSKLFSDLPEAISNTELVAEMCELNIDFNQLRLPQYKLPSNITADDYLSNLCWQGLQERLPRADSELKQRLEYELEVIKNTQFANYFLVVWDIARFVKQNDIMLAVRGSAAASLALYCLYVTNIEPVQYELVFERFLNNERKEMPDIDMDFQDDRREEVINYVVSKYGQDHVAQIITFGTMGARASIRDVGRALGMSYGDVDRVAKLVPTKLNITLESSLDESEEMNEIYNADATTKKLIDTAKGLEGLTRHTSTHAAGVVISENPLDEIIPLQLSTKGTDESATMTQFSMDPIAEMGLLKMDFLGLSNLTILDKTRRLINSLHNKSLSLNDISLKDQPTFELLSRGETVGVFQMEGSGMTRYLKELKPTSIEDVSAMIALYRPGPMEHITTFIDAKHGRKKVQYLHPSLEKILKETYGVIVYQDQVLNIFRTFAGYSFGEADIVRKAMGKKIPEIMAQEKDNFINGANTLGYPQDLATQLYNLTEPFAGYAFNKAHSVSYGLISYWTAYFKANYPVEYMTSLLNVYSGNNDKIHTAIEECRRLSIPVLPPDLNNSFVDFSIESTESNAPAIRWGLGSLMNVSHSSIKPLVESRSKLNPPIFQSIEHLCESTESTGLSRKILESLIKSGSLDSFGDRSALLSVIDRIISLSQSESQMRNSMQTSMFEAMQEGNSENLASINIPIDSTSDTQKDTWEQESLGVNLSNNKLFDVLEYCEGGRTITGRYGINFDMAGQKIEAAGIISSVTHRVTRSNQTFCISTLQMSGGTIELFVWENVLQNTKEVWKENNAIIVEGNVRVRNDELSISITSANEINFNSAQKLKPANGSK
ncbi:MAG: DNA polymerase III subunit alpha, partial [Thaumarchaeota archaeon]|nr:DNA polymerase III subunit alpha [Nitrososphaerota archaeon]